MFQSFWYGSFILNGFIEKPDAFFMYCDLHSRHSLLIVVAAYQVLDVVKKTAAAVGVRTSSLLHLLLEVGRAK